jgi:putative membrane protein
MALPIKFDRMSADDALVRLLLIIVAIVLLIPFLMMVFAWLMMGMWGGGHMWNDGMWDSTGATWMWLVMWLVGLAIVVGLGYLLYRVVRRPTGRETDTALDEELRVAYAQGELSDEEYKERRERLRRE